MNNKIHNTLIKISKIITKNINHYKKETNYKFSNKTNLYDAVSFDLLCTEKYSCQSDATTDISMYNKIKVSRQSLAKRAMNMKQTFYDNLFENLSTSFKNDLINTYNLKAVDGTSINIYDKTVKNKYTSKNILGIYDSTNNIPITLHASDNYKSEIALLYEYIDKTEFEKQDTFVMDRLYHSDKLIKKLNDKNINYILRIKKNSRYLNSYKIKQKILDFKEKNKEKINNSSILKKYDIILKKEEEIKKENDNIDSQYNSLCTECIMLKNINKIPTKIINKKIQKSIIANKLIEDIENDKFNINDHEIIINSKQLRIITYKVKKSIIHLVTNILDKNIEYFKNAYNDRWDVEIMFKKLKNNTNIENIKIQNKDAINKKISCSSVILLIISLIKKEYDKLKDNIKSELNDKQFTRNFYKYILLDLIKGRIKNKILIDVINIILITYIKDERDRCFIRIAIRPYSKWKSKERLNRLN